MKVCIHQFWTIVILSVMAIVIAFLASPPPLVQKILQGQVTDSLGNTRVVQLGSRVGPAYLYPDPSLTPSKRDTTNIQDVLKIYNGQTYSQSHRNVTSATKTKVCQEYNCKVPREIDHFFPVALGGSNDAENLWAQPETNVWNRVDYGFHTKDKLEDYVIREVKAGHSTLQEAYTCLVFDWVKCYQNNFGNKLGGAGSMDYDGEDEIQ